MSTKLSRANGFTIVELLVVVGILGVILGLLLPALSSAREASRNMASQSNIRQITNGLIAFSVGHKDEVISSNTRRSFNAGGDVGQVTCKAWVEASPGNIYTSDEGTQFELPSALSEGYAAPYLDNGGYQRSDATDGGIYKSPLDNSGRIRSYSLNGAVGRVPDVGFMEVLEDLDLGERYAPARSMAHVKIPGRTMYVIPEAMSYCGNPVQYNIHGFIVNFFDPIWIDAPAFWAKDGINLSFLDGHTEFHFWANRHIDGFVQTTPTYFGGEDFDYIKSIMMPELEHLIGADGG